MKSLKKEISKGIKEKNFRRKSVGDKIKITEK